MHQVPDRGPLNRRFFWDVRPETLDIQEHETFIIERLLEEGDDAAVVWMYASFPRQAIERVVRHSRRLSKRTGTFFALEFGIPKSEVRCLTRQSLSQLATPWSR